MLVIDRLNQDMCSLFSEKNSALYTEIWYLSPRNFDHVADVNTFSVSTLPELSDLDEIELKDELIFCKPASRFILLIAIR